MTLEWYVVQANSGFEKRVKQSLENRVAESNMQDKFGEILIPEEEVVEMRAGKKRNSKRRLFPGYVFVNMEMNSETWHLVKSVPRVQGFMGGVKGNPAPIPSSEIKVIMNDIQEGVDKPKLRVLFEVGEMVRVTSGPFNDFNAVVEEIIYEKSKLQVSVQIFGRSTPVELNFGQVEKV